MNKQEKPIIKATMEDLEEASLGELWEMCPMCGTKGKDHYCENCKKEWKPGYFYFSGNADLSWGK